MPTDPESIRNLAGRMRQIEREMRSVRDSGRVLDLARELRRTAEDLRALTKGRKHDHAAD